MDTGMPSKELPQLQSMQEEIIGNYKDIRAVMGQQTLDYLIDKLELPDNLQTAFFDWLVSEKFIHTKIYVWMMLNMK